MNRSSDPLSDARQFLEEEAQALHALAAALDTSFTKAAELIFDIPHEGRLVISGIGKAGLIAMKVSATFASIGTASFFLHPSEAEHGDLGRLTKHDVAVIFSKSGHTAELVRILPSIRHIGTRLISITCDPKSPLAEASEVVISIAVVAEAGHLKLAPTSSAVAMLAVGDALAMEVARLRGVSAQDFGRLHPGGTLGRTLLPVEQIMRKGEAHCIVPEDMTCREVLHRITLTKGRPGAASVVDRRGRLVGIFTDGDLRRLLDQGAAFLEEPVSKVMGKSPLTIAQTALAIDALRAMTARQVDQLIVAGEDSVPVGMIDIQDVVG